jgi:hypothetical protein
MFVYQTFKSSQSRFRLAQYTYYSFLCVIIISIVIDFLLKLLTVFTFSHVNMDAFSAPQTGAPSTPPC